jgi:hypothetical protein
MRQVFSPNDEVAHQDFNNGNQMEKRMASKTLDPDSLS